MLTMMERVLNSLGPFFSSSKSMANKLSKRVSATPSSFDIPISVVHRPFKHRRVSCSSWSSCSSRHSTAMVRCTRPRTSLMPPSEMNWSTHVTVSLRRRSLNLCRRPTSTWVGSRTVLRYVTNSSGSNGSRLLLEDGVLGDCKAVDVFMAVVVRTIELERDADFCFFDGEPSPFVKLKFLLLVLLFLVSGDSMSSGCCSG